MQIVEVTTKEQTAHVRELFEEYWTSFGFTPCFQDFGAELAGLPGGYAPPGGRLALALVAGQPVGCAALRRLDEERCEFKRLYVRPQFRGGGRGRQLLAWVIAEARAAGYRQAVCDTMPAMAQALAMYERAGFERTEPYSPHPTPGAIFLRLQLDSGSLRQSPPGSR
jgi:GNAT superfamily N-acetyltransferase